MNITAPPVVTVLVPAMKVTVATVEAAPAVTAVVCVTLVGCDGDGCGRSHGGDREGPRYYSGICCDGGSTDGHRGGP